MHRVGIGLVFVGAGIWVISGAVIFSSDFARGYSDATKGSQMAAVVVATQGSSDNPADAVTYRVVGGSARGQAIADQAAQPTPWYDRFFGNFASFFSRIIPGMGAPVRKGPVMEVSVPAKKLSAPACAISIDPNSVPYDGSATVMWSSRNAEHVIFQGIGEVAQSGSMPISHLTSSRAFALAVQGSGGTSSCYTVVDVEAVNADPPTCIISAHPSSIVAGASASLAWGAKNASTATIIGLGSVPSTGGATVSPQTTTTYTLTVRSPMGKETTCRTTVSVQ